MLAKQVKGRDFNGCLTYVLGKPGAIKIGGNMRGQDSLALSHEFDQLVHDRSHLTRKVYHCALSLPPGETVSDPTWRKIAQDYLKAMGFADCQYILVRHTDTEHHQHVHIVANRVGMDGKTVSDSFDHYRCQTVVRAIEDSYNLQRVSSSWESGRKALSLRQLKKEVETGKPSVQRILQETIADAIPESLSLADLVDRLQTQKIRTHGFYGRRGGLQGIAYEVEGVMMSGTALGHDYQVGGLRSRLEKQGVSLEWHSEQEVETARRGTIAAIQGAAFDQPKLSVLCDRLRDEGIDLHVQFAKVGRFGRRAKAIQYRAGEICFHGSDLGSSYTLQGLHNRLGVTLDEVEQRSQAVEVRVMSRAIDEILRDSVLESLTQLLRQLSEEAKQKREDKLEVYSNLEPGLNHWLALAALYLKVEENLPIALVVEQTINPTVPQSQGIRDQADRVIQANSKNRPIPSTVWIDYGDGEPNLDSDPKHKVLRVKPQISIPSYAQDLQEFDRA